MNFGRMGLGRLGLLAGGGTSGYSFTNAEAAAVVAAFSVPPSNTRKGVIDTLVGSLKTGGIWSQLDLLYLMAAADSQAGRINWVAPGSNTLTAVNSPTFTADRGFTGDGSTSYLDTGIAPNALTQLTQNDAHVGAYVQAAGNGTAAVGRSTGGATLLINPRSAGSQSIRVNGNGGSTQVVATAAGHHVGVRVGSTESLGFKDGGSKTTGAGQNSVARDSASILIGRTGTGYSTDTIAAMHAGAGLSDAEVTAFYNALNTYMVAVGAA